MILKTIQKKGLLFCLFIMLAGSIYASVSLPAIFGDNMVLQRNIRVPIWGQASPGEKIQIVFRGKTFKTTAGTDGKWKLRLDKYEAGGPYQMQIEGEKEHLTFGNILIGDVWVASGQSNMEFGIQTEKHGADAIAKATDTLIHFFFVPMTFALQPQADVLHEAAGSPNGKWVVCSPAMLANPKWAWHGFSAVGYYFAQQLRQSQNCPVGMIATYKGGTPAQAWVSPEGLQQGPAFQTYVNKHQQLVDHYDEAKAAYPQQLAAYQEALKTWNTEIGADFAVATKQWEVAVAQAKANKQPLPVKPKSSRPAPQNPPVPEGGFSAPGNLYNAMVAPIVPYGIKGVIWYQGESNGDRLADAVEYKDLFPRLISDWRKHWDEGNFPFLYVQLPNYHAVATTPSDGFWPWVREAQLKTLGLQKTGMAVTIDVGETENIHPTNKLDVGLRLALVARHNVYGENIVSSGPMFKSYKIENNKIRITFSNTENGMLTGNMQSARGTELKGFGIAGADQKFVWAKAVIEGNTVVVSADDVPNPESVRYNWTDNPPGSLYNKEGLPASPFRTDNWAPPLAVQK